MRAPVVVACFALACNDFDLVRPEGDVAPILNVSVVLVHQDSATYDVAAYLRPGTDSEGRPRILADSTVTVDGAVLAPHASPNVISYQWRDVRAAVLTPRTELVVRAPRVEDYGDTPLLTIPMSARVGPYRSDLRFGDDLVLAVTPVPDSSSGLNRRGSGLWQLTLTEDASPPFISVQGSGVAPALTIPGAWLEGYVSPGDSMTATLLQFHGYEHVNAPFAIAASTFTRVHWRVRLTAP